MDVSNIKPSDTYEGLKRQFNALKTMYQSQQKEIDVYRKAISRFRIERIIQLEAELESHKEMNAILTEELSNLLDKQN